MFLHRITKGERARTHTYYDYTLETLTEKQTAMDTHRNVPPASLCFVHQKVIIIDLRLWSEASSRLQLRTHFIMFTHYWWIHTKEKHGEKTCNKERKLHEKWGVKQKIMNNLSIMKIWRREEKYEEKENGGEKRKKIQ